MYNILKPDRKMVEKITALAMDLDFDATHDDDYSVEEDAGTFVESWMY